jgi:hypothetical protein
MCSSVLPFDEIDLCKPPFCSAQGAACNNSYNAKNLRAMLSHRAAGRSKSTTSILVHWVALSALLGAENGSVAPQYAKLGEEAWQASTTGFRLRVPARICRFQDAALIVDDEAHLHFSCPATAVVWRERRLAQLHKRSQMQSAAAVTRLYEVKSGATR